MAIKLATVVNPKFQEVLVKLSKSKIPVKTAFKLKGVMKTVQAEFEKYEDCRKEALDKYGTRDDDGKLLVDDNNNVRLEGENLQAFAKELSELTNMEIQIDSLSVDELGDDCGLTTEDFIYLEDIIRD
jgi:hypothetical protein